MGDLITGLEDHVKDDLLRVLEQQIREIRELTDLNKASAEARSQLLTRNQDLSDDLAERDREISELKTQLQLAQTAQAAIPQTLTPMSHASLAFSSGPRALSDTTDFSSMALPSSSSGQSSVPSMSQMGAGPSHSLRPRPQMVEEALDDIYVRVENGTYKAIRDVLSSETITWVTDALSEWKFKGHDEFDVRGLSCDDKCLRTRLCNMPTLIPPTKNTCYERFRTRQPCIRRFSMGSEPILVPVPSRFQESGLTLRDIKLFNRASSKALAGGWQLCGPYKEGSGV